MTQSQRRAISPSHQSNSVSVNVLRECPPLHVNPNIKPIGKTYTKPRIVLDVRIPMRMLVSSDWLLLWVPSIHRHLHPATHYMKSNLQENVADIVARSDATNSSVAFHATSTQFGAGAGNNQYASRQIGSRSRFSRFWHRTKVVR